MRRKQIKIESAVEKELIKQLETRNDFKSLRLKKLLALPDLTRQANSPVKFLVDAILSLPDFLDFDLVDFPRIVSVEENFDLLNTPKDHPSRRETDTFYVDEDHVLRTQMTVMWSFYLKSQEVLERLEREGEVGALSYGIVFRKDEIDRNHYPAFHQIDGLYLCKRSLKEITVQDLKEVQLVLAKGIFGPNIEYRFLTDTFPFTDPSVEMDIKFNGEWLEVNGAGLVHSRVLENFGIDPRVYNGWAFGFGDRLAMIKAGINDIRVLWSQDPRITRQFTSFESTYTPVSKYPPVVRDISFVVDKEMKLNNYYEIVRDIGGDLIEEVKMIDTYQDDNKFGKDKISYTFRIVYRSLLRTLTNKEVNMIHEKLQQKTISEFGGVIR
jgi:phenylalanyl-tRNA synthetase alpha chain